MSLSLSQEVFLTHVGGHVDAWLLPIGDIAI